MDGNKLVIENHIADTSEFLQCNAIVEVCYNSENLSKSNDNTNNGASTSNSFVESIDKQHTMKEDTSSAHVVNVTRNSLCNLLVYTSGESSNSEEESSDSDSYECESDTQEVEKCMPQLSKKKTNGCLNDTLKSIGELCIEDLPPVPDLSKLNLGVNREDCDEIGKISSIVDKLVMVESIANKPAYDIDTLLFLDNGKQPLGYIFDVIGAVTCPLYAIRFNSKEEIATLNITKGLPVFSAPKSEHTQYIFVQQLLKAKGSDASWKDDLEVPQEFQDFSDDEAELSKRRINPDSRKRNSIERYRNFEKDMNIKNVIDTRLHKIRDNFEPLTKKQTPSNNHKRGYQFQPNYPPNFGFSQANTSSTSCAFPPPFGMPTFMPSNMPVPPYGPQNIPPFMSSLPPPPSNFIPGLPPSLPNMPYPPMQQNITFPSPDMVNHLYRNVQMVPANTTQTKTTHQLMYPPDMGLPRPPLQNPNFVPNLPFYDPRVPIWHNFSSPPPNARKSFPKPRNYFPKRQ